MLSLDGGSVLDRRDLPAPASQRLARRAGPTHRDAVDPGNRRGVEQGSTVCAPLGPGGESLPNMSQFMRSVPEHPTR